MTTRAFIRLALVVSAALLGACGNDASPTPEEIPANLFQRQIEKPTWFATLEVPSLSTANELDELWRSKRRCCIDERTLVANNREFYKACYEAIGRHFDDHVLVVQCLWLMDAGAEGDQRRQIKQFLVEHYFDHDNRVDNCANCSPADTVARVSRELALLHLRAGRPDEASRLLERVIDERQGKISPWVQTEIYGSLARIYQASEVTEVRKARLRTAYERLSALAEQDEAVARRLGNYEKVYRQVSER
jgi:hypothetical protein